MIRNFKIEDTPQLLSIYNFFVLNSVVTFDLEVRAFEAFKHKVSSISSQFPFIVYELENEVLGFAYGNTFRPRPAYNNTVESTIYVKHDSHGKQIGTMLYTRLIELLAKCNYHSVIGILTIPNVASEQLHKKMGFKQVGLLKEVGFKFKEWHDIGIFQLKLN